MGTPMQHLWRGSRVRFSVQTSMESNNRVHLKRAQGSKSRVNLVQLDEGAAESLYGDFIMIIIAGIEQDLMIFLLLVRKCLADTGLCSGIFTFLVW